MARRLAVDAFAVWLAVRDPRTPAAARIVGGLVAAYALSPIDLIPDFIPVIGLLDDAILIPAGIALMIRMIPPEQFAEHRAAAAAATDLPTAVGGIAIVGAVWAAVLVLGYLAFG